MGTDNKAHRAGSLKQTNKKHKTGRHRSKGAIDNDQKGKISVKALTRKHKQVVRKEQRRNQANQIRKNKREEIIAKKRSLGGSETAPFLVCILPLNAQIDPNSALAIFENCDAEALVNKTESGVTHITIPRFKQRFSFIVPPVGRGKEMIALDCLKVADTTVMLLTANTDEDDIIDKWGRRILHMAIAQGIPTPIISLMDLESIAPKRKITTKAFVQKLISKSFPAEKLMCLDTNAEAFNVLRRIGGQKQKPLYNKDNRPHMFGEAVDYISNADNEMYGTLKVTGFLRGTPLDVNGLVHIPGLGDFQMLQIDAQIDEFKLDRGRDVAQAKSRLLATADPARQIVLQKENIPDEMDAEQTMPTEEEIAMAQEETRTSRLIKRVPKGMSDYQACWIPDIEEVDNEVASQDDDDDDGSDNDDEFMSCDSEKSDKFQSDGELEECDTVTVSEAPVNDDKYDLDMDLQEERETFQKIKEARTDQMWPDEIDTPFDIAARVRFQKYRGLESFRTSTWDCKENLPFDYARIFQFHNFDRTKRRIVKEAVDADGAQPGWYITVHVANVPQILWQTWIGSQSTHYLIMYGLLPHEHQMCVVNTVLKRTPDSTIPLRSKEKLVVQCGYRRYVVNPIFSAHTNGDKHKYERFFRANETVVATFYAPIQFPPAPILCFQYQPDSSLKLVANGILLSCNPNRIVLKRIVLSGHPLKINRKSATVRYMFYNKEDIEYFQPVKLRTRCGRLGHIKESLGTHGHMKCVFDGQLKSFDTVFMYLYKRCFPKWTYEEYTTGSTSGSTRHSIMSAVSSENDAMIVQ